MSVFRWTVLLTFLATPGAGMVAQGAGIDFRRTIHPILSNACFQCHGPDAEHREADLRLDTLEGAFENHDGHQAFRPGRPRDSEAIRRITATDPDLKMPPPDSGKALTARQIEQIRRWVAQGATWSKHWAFETPLRPAIPSVTDRSEDHGGSLPRADGDAGRPHRAAGAKQDGWVQNPIDAFVLARLARAGLAPSPRADRVTLLRRLSLDLIGLPPTIEEIDAFLADRRSNAWQAQVNRLLQSPHYGEHWARKWLDAARYADSDGFEKDKPRSVWFYRDWVVRALNGDMPYNQFIVEQIAGDLLPGATQDQIVATGFLRNSMINEEGGADPEQFRMEAMFDRMDAVGTAILGLTIRCGQCHDHKYDPLTQREYYRMFAFLNNCHEAQITVYTPAEQAKREAVLREIRSVEGSWKQRNPAWRAAMLAWEVEQRKKKATVWHVVELVFDATTIGGQKFRRLDDGSYLAQGYAPTKFRPVMTGTTTLKKVTAVRLELLTDPNLPRGGPGRALDGTCAVTEFELQSAPLDAPTRKQRVAIATASSDLNLPERPLRALFSDRSKRRRTTGPIAFAVDGRVETAWGIDAGPGRRNVPRKAVFAFAEPVVNAAGTRFSVTLAQQHGGWNSDDNQTHNIGRFRISVTDAPHPVADPVPLAVRRILGVRPSRRTKAQAEAVFSYWRTTQPGCQDINAKIDGLWQQHPEGTTQLVLAERRRPRETHRLERGNFLQPREVVTPGVPHFLHPLRQGEPATRLTFARWLADPRSPTTSRAIVNRVWQAYFGTGLVATSDDFGSQGKAPSHPELLDWLAVDFMENGWSLKRLHRLIVTSATYRQSSVLRGPSVALDPRNRLLARGPRFRVAAEVVRDIALAASGLLNGSLGGPSVYPPAPALLFVPPASYGPKTWLIALGPSRYRRALYTFRFRSVPYPVLDTFDAPNGDQACVRRERSNTPLQALTTLNEPLFLECAAGLAARTLKTAGPSDQQRLTYAFRRCLARRPTAAERILLLAFLDRQRIRFSKAEVDPAALLAGTTAATKPSTGSANAVDLAAWTTVSRVLLNLDETIVKQ